MTNITTFDASMLEVDKEKQLINLTKMAKSFDRDINQWKRLPSVVDFIDAYKEQNPSCENYITVIQGGNDKLSQGTWGNRDMAIKFAQWLNPKFEVFCIKHLNQLFTNGSVSLAPKLPQTFSEALKLAYEQSLIIEEQTKLIKEKTEQLDESKEWYSIKRVAKLVKKPWQSFNWKMLKNESVAMEIDVKKVFDANFPQGVNIYHVDVWTTIYPELTDLLIKK